MTNKKTKVEYAFCLIIGGIYLYSLALAVFSATIINVASSELLTISVLSIVIFLLIFYNRITRVVTSAIVGLFILYVLFLLWRDVYLIIENPVFLRFSNTFFMIVGQMSYTPELGRTAVWLFNLAFAIIVVIFMFHKFSFVMLALTGAAVFVLTWGPGFRRNETAFLLFLFVFCAILIRKMNNSVRSSMVFVPPICALVVWITHINMPAYSEMFVRRNINQTLNSAMATIGDHVFEIFNPTHFSFQTTGFGGNAGRLGGPITPNSRPVMDVFAPGGTYLAGAVRNTYTGYSWISTLEEGQINTHGLTPGQFEMLETAAALMRGATIAHEAASIPPHARNFMYTPSPGWEPVLIQGDRLRVDQSQVLGVVLNGGYFLHSYLPMDTIHVYMGRNRTGTIFRPVNAWNLQFSPASTNYMDVLSVLPLGDMQTPRVMSRGTRYNMQFLNIDTTYTFTNYMLSQARKGFYANRAAESMWWLQQATFNGAVTWIDTHFDFWWARRPETLSFWNSTIDIIMEIFYEGELDAELFELFNHHFALSHPWASLRISEDNDLIVQIDHDAHYEINNFLRSFEFPDPREDVRISYVVEYFQNAAYFGVQEMQMLLELFTSSRDGNLLGYSPLYEYWSDWTMSEHGEYGEYDEEADTLLSILRWTPRNTIAGPGAARDGSIMGYIPREEYLIRWLDEFTTHVLIDYAREIREHFLYVPEIVTPRVHDLTMEIIQGQTNDFDRIMAIRDYLLEFPYTLTPAPVPRDVCFVDHFLFEGREGYCTYFASAMAIMSRIAGVPSRYVEGFVLPPSFSPGNVTVTNRMAHAWVEVYLEGFGWLLVEATPTYAYIMNHPLLAEGIGGVFGDSHYEPDWERIMGVRRGWYEAPDLDPDLGGAFGGFGVNANIEDERTPLHPLVVTLGFVIFVLGSILIFFLVRFLQIKYDINKVRKLSPNGQTLAYFGGILDIITYYTHPMVIGETPRAYGLHKGRRFAFRSDTVFFRDLIALYNKAKYSAHEITEAERALMEEAYFDMMTLLRRMRMATVFVYLVYIRRIGRVRK